MALGIEQYETPLSRKMGWTGQTQDGHRWYVRHYHVAPENFDVIPEPGDSFPSIDALVAGKPELGPYVRNVRYGERVPVAGGGTVQLVILEGRGLKERDATTQEIAGRRSFKTATHYVYECKFAGQTLVDSLPKRGDALPAYGAAGGQSFDHDSTAYCTNVSFDETTEPGRVIAHARYEAPIGWDEAYL